MSCVLVLEIIGSVRACVSVYVGWCACVCVGVCSFIIVFVMTLCTLHVCVCFLFFVRPICFTIGCTQAHDEMWVTT